MARPLVLPQGMHIVPVCVLDRPPGQVPGLRLLVSSNRYRIGKDAHMKSALNTMCFVALVLAAQGINILIAN